MTILLQFSSGFASPLAGFASRLAEIRRTATAQTPAALEVTTKKAKTGVDITVLRQGRGADLTAAPARRRGNSIPPEVWSRVRNFLEDHMAEGGKEGRMA